MIPASLGNYVKHKFIVQTYWVLKIIVRSQLCVAVMGAWKEIKGLAIAVFRMSIDGSQDRSKEGIL